MIEQGYEIINVDKLTYSGNLDCLRSIEQSPGYRFHHADIADGEAMTAILAEHQPDSIMHLAAETHVDRSIDRPHEFIETNIVGSFTLLDAALAYWRSLSG